MYGYTTDDTMRHSLQRAALLYPQPPLLQNFPSCLLSIPALDSRRQAYQWRIPYRISSRSVAAHIAAPTAMPHTSVLPVLRCDAAAFIFPSKHIPTPLLPSMLLASYMAARGWFNLIMGPLLPLRFILNSARSCSPVTG